MQSSTSSSTSSAAQTPAVDLILKSFAESPEKGRAAAKKYLSNAKTYAEKWLVLVTIFHKISPAEAEKARLFFGKVPLSEKLSAYSALQETLVDITLPTQTIEVLIPFLLAQRLLSTEDLSYLYNALAEKSDNQEDSKSALVFYQKALDQPSKILGNKHSLNVNLGRICKALKKPDLSHQYFSTAHQMEEKLDASYLTKNGVIKYLLTQFITSMTKSLDRPDTDWILQAHKLERSERVLKIANLYFGKAIARFDADKDINTLINAFNLAVKISATEKITVLLQIMESVPEEVCSRMRMAMFYMAAKKYDSAFKLLVLIVHEEPGNVLANIYIADILCQQENFISAETVLLDLLKEALSKEHKERVYTFLTRVYVDLTMPDQAVFFANEALKINPSNIIALANRIKASCLYSPSKASKLLKKAKMDFPNDPDILECERIILATRGRSQDESKETVGDEISVMIGNVYYHLHHQEYDLAETKALPLLAMPTNIAVVQIVLGQLFSFKKEYEKAIFHYKNAQNPSNKLLISQLIQKPYLETENYEMLQEAALYVIENEKGLSVGNKKIKLIAYNNLLTAYIGSTRVDEGIKQFEIFLAKAISQEERADCCVHLAALHEMQQNFIKVDECLTQVLSFSPYKSAKLYFLLGKNAFQSRQFDKAIAAFTLFTKMEPYNAFGFYVLGMAFVSVENVSSAKHNFDRAIEMFPMYAAFLARALPTVVWEKLFGSANTGEDNTDSNQQEIVVSKPENSSVSTFLLANNDSLQNPFQIQHNFFQREKLRRLDFQSNMSLPDEKLGEHQWMVPGLGLITSTDKRVKKVTFSNHNPELSRLYAMLNRPLLEKAVNDEKVIDEWQTLLDKGAKIVCKKNKQGIKLLKDKEIADVGEGYCAKLKLLGFYGNIRAHAKDISTQATPEWVLLCFDKVTKKSHLK